MAFEQMHFDDWDLIFINGQDGKLKVPIYKDSRLNEIGERDCKRLLKEAELCDEVIRSKEQCDTCISTFQELRKGISRLRLLKRDHGELLVKLKQQITTATEGLENKLSSASDRIDKRVVAWREKLEEGRKRQLELLEQKAYEREQKAKYDSDPQVSRQAKVEAKQLRNEAKEFKHKAIPRSEGFDTVDDFEIEVEDRVLAAKNHEDYVAVEPRREAILKKIKEEVRAGRAIPLFPGLRIRKVTRVRYAR